MARYQLCHGCRSLRLGDATRCEKGHALGFRLPRDPLDLDWGYYRKRHRRCPDREDGVSDG